MPNCGPHPDPDPVTQPVRTLSSTRAHHAAQVDETLIVVSTTFDDPTDEGQQEARMRGRLIVYKLNCYPSPSDTLSGPAQDGAAPAFGSDTLLYDGHRCNVLLVRPGNPRLTIVNCH